MRRTSLITLCLVALGPVALGGCSAFENLGGGKKVSPDEFKIVSHSPLTMPPNAELRPPRPGEPRPQEVTPADQAKEALSPALAGRNQARAAGAGGGPPPPAGGSEQALVAKAGQSAGSGIDPNIRSRVNQDTKTLNDNDKSFVDSLIFWQSAAALRRRHRPDQGAAAAARRPGGRPARLRQPADHHAAQARPPRRRLLRPASVRRRALLGGLAAGAALAPSAPALAKLFSVERRRSETFSLPNGLQVVVLPSSRAPIVTQVLVYKAGSADEVFGQDRRRAFPRAHDVQGHRHGGPHRVLAHRVEEWRPRQRLHDLRFDRLLPDGGARPARAGDAHGSRPHGRSAHHREGADPRAPGRARGAAHANRQFAQRAARRGGAGAAVRPAQALRHADQRLCRRRQEAHRRRPDGVLSRSSTPPTTPS